MAIAPGHKLNLRVRLPHAAGTGTAIVFARPRQFSVCLIALLLTTGAAMLGGCSPINHLRDDYMGKSLLQPGKARPGNGSMTDPALERARRYSEDARPATAAPAQTQSGSSQLPRTPPPSTQPQQTQPGASDSRIGFPTLRRHSSGATPNSGPVPRDDYGNPILN